jgi:hypothetical protein
MEDDCQAETKRVQARLNDSESRIVALCLGNDAKSIGAFTRLDKMKLAGDRLLTIKRCASWSAKQAEIARIAYVHPIFNHYETGRPQNGSACS